MINLHVVSEHDEPVCGVRLRLLHLCCHKLALLGKYVKRKSRFKRSDGSTSSDTTSNSFVRQSGNTMNPPQVTSQCWECRVCSHRSVP
ncbi:hypothetical protein AAFF_G00420230 [Aldrovandia affinis]|uniref:Uncharacterized protein n=1 Tax=Aldrovandia affinis TaxID=143900 RepID=A0AAD7SCG2_9TELE|nr:hypothetical protein AAFF_G00420230 [Aldrovandia affinis]